MATDGPAQSKAPHTDRWLRLLALRCEASAAMTGGGYEARGDLDGLDKALRLCGALGAAVTAAGELARRAVERGEEPEPDPVALEELASRIKNQGDWFVRFQARRDQERAAEADRRRVGLADDDRPSGR